MFTATLGQSSPKGDVITELPPITTSTHASDYAHSATNPETTTTSAGTRSHTSSARSLATYAHASTHVKSTIPMETVS